MKVEYMEKKSIYFLKFGDSLPNFHPPSPPPLLTKSKNMWQNILFSFLFFSFCTEKMAVFK
jgi:hypothetical protein